MGIAAREHRHGRWFYEGPTVLRFGSSVDRLATPLGIDERLAFRAFDETIIFGHWLSKTQKLALASGAFLLKKAFTISQQTIFKRAKKSFSKILFPKKMGLRYFHMGLYRFPHVLYSFSSHANIGEQNLISPSLRIA